MQTTFERYLALLRELAGTPPILRSQSLEQPLVVNDRVVTRDLFEETYIVAKLPKTLLGRGGRP